MAYFRCIGGSGGGGSESESPRIVEIVLENTNSANRSSISEKSFTVEKDDIILIGVMYDGTNINTPTGYTKLKTTPSYNSTWTAIFYKKITQSGTESVTISQTTNNHLQAIYFQIRGSKGVTDAQIDDYVSGTGSANFTRTLTNRPFIVFLSNGSLSTSGGWKITPNYAVIINNSPSTSYIDAMIGLGSCVNGSYNLKNTTIRGYALCGVYLTEL